MMALSEKGDHASRMHEVIVWDILQVNLEGDVPLILFPIYHKDKWTLIPEEYILKQTLWLKKLCLYGIH